MELIGGLLGLLALIFWIRRRWRAREALGYTKVAYWWEAIIHGFAVCIVLVFGFFMLIFLLTRGNFEWSTNAGQCTAASVGLLRAVLLPLIVTMGVSLSVPDGFAAYSVIVDALRLTA